MMEKIRVLHIIKTLGLGGAEANLLNLIEAMDASRFESFVAYSAGGELESRFVSADVKLFKFSEGDHKLKSFASFGIVGRLSKFIRKNQIDIVHTHTFNAHIWGGIAAKLAGAKLLEHVHDLRYLEPEDYVRRRGMSRQNWSVHYLKNFSDKVVVLTQQNAQFLAAYKLYPTEKVRVLRNGIPLTADKSGLNVSPSPLSSPPAKGRGEGEEFSLRDKFGISRDAVVILTPVRIAPEKNVDLILRIAPDVVSKCPKAVFVIAGDGPLLATFRQETRDKRLEANVRFVGFQSDMHGMLAMSDIFLLPSFLELHSIALLEAMSKAKPVVISRNVGCHSEFIRDGENGFLLDPFNDLGWADAVMRLAIDPALRLCMGLSAQKTCNEQFDIKCVVKKFEMIYEELWTCKRCYVSPLGYF